MKSAKGIICLGDFQLVESLFYAILFTLCNIPYSLDNSTTKTYNQNQIIYRYNFTTHVCSGVLLWFDATRLPYMWLCVSRSYSFVRFVCSWTDERESNILGYGTVCWFGFNFFSFFFLFLYLLFVFFPREILWGHKSCAYISIACSFLSPENDILNHSGDIVLSFVV